MSLFDILEWSTFWNTTSGHGKMNIIYSRKGKNFFDSWKFTWKHKLLIAGYGAGVLCGTFIPIYNIFFFFCNNAGATRLYNHIISFEAKNASEEVKPLIQSEQEKKTKEEQKEENKEEQKEENKEEQENNEEHEEN